MEFFIPLAKNFDEALDTYNGVKRFMQDQGFEPLDKYIYRIEFNFEGKDEFAKVGDSTTFNNELVVVMFECEDYFLICTINRGVVGGEPILMGVDKITDIEYFDSFPTG